MSILAVMFVSVVAGSSRAPRCKHDVNDLFYKTNKNRAASICSLSENTVCILQLPVFSCIYFSGL